MKKLQWPRASSVLLLLVLVVWIKPVDLNHFGQPLQTSVTAPLAQDPGHGGGGGG